MWYVIDITHIVAMLPDRSTQVSHPEEDAHIKVYCALTGKELVKNYSSLQDDQEALDAYLLGLKERTALNKAVGTVNTS